MSTEIETGPDEAAAAGAVERAPDRHRAERPEHEVEWAIEQHVYEPHRVGLPPIGA
ncbi:MAG: hypothetical protein QOF65_1823, partial [Thermoleophilaceae bacterium]|nr:hypothetical protein [Thermoleophilaceae bacterium]